MVEGRKSLGLWPVKQVIVLNCEPFGARARNYVDQQICQSQQLSSSIIH